MDFQEKKILVVGSGISGVAAVKLLRDKGSRPVLYDGNEKLDVGKIRESFSGDMDGGQLEIYLGTLPDEVRDNIDMVVLSPGVPTDILFVEEFRKANVPIIGEIELAYLCGKGTVIGITGTNGKTTTTALTGEIMKNHFEQVFVVGNIGIPYTGVVGQTTEDSVIVAEISSFQLETIDTFCPKVSAVLNVTPDHLNRHHTMENYIRAKADIARNQTKEQTCVLNFDNEITRGMADEMKADVLFFSRKETLDNGICLDGDQIVYIHDGTKDIICGVSQMQLVGDCNVENVMAASAIAIRMGVPIATIANTVAEFKAVPHRIEFVREVHGVRYYNDSKGTNPDAAIQGIKAMDRPTVLLAGGYDKKSEYDDWLKECVGKVKALILIGQTKEMIREAAQRLHIPNIILKETFEEAMEECVRLSESGDAVLLSPACASWGMFDNYEQRGDMFKEFVNKIE